jgi:Ca-activated chloride channel family protein
MNWRANKLVTMLLGGVAALLTAALLLGTATRDDFWSTPDQRARRLFDRGDYAAAAETAEDAMLAGVAWFEAKDFEKAEAAFARSGKPEAWFNMGNCRIFLGRYQSAVEAYDAALERRPDWTEARDNREIARIRAERMNFEGGEMGDQKLGADEIVFNQGMKKQQGGQDTRVEGGPSEDKQLQAMWLRRLDTRPADFLKAKFAWQAAQPEEPEP